MACLDICPDVHNRSVAASFLSHMRAEDCEGQANPVLLGPFAEHGFVPVYFWISVYPCICVYMCMCVCVYVCMTAGWAERLSFEAEPPRRAMLRLGRGFEGTFQSHQCTSPEAAGAARYSVVVRKTFVSVVESAAAARPPRSRSAPPAREGQFF